jgi:hypothetical protein
VRLIDYVEGSGQGFPFYAQILAEKSQTKGYVYGTHWAPHDISVRELGTGKSRIETARSLGIHFETSPRLLRGEARSEVEEGINAVRVLLPRCWFDEQACEAGLEALQHYRRDFNLRLNEFTAVPVHDWASHGSDAFRGLAVRHQIPRPPTRQERAQPLPTSATAWMGA